MQPGRCRTYASWTPIRLWPPRPPRSGWPRSGRRSATIPRPAVTSWREPFARVCSDAALPERNFRENCSELADEVDHFVLLRRRDLREHWQRQNAPLVAMRVRKLFGAMAKPLVCGKERQCRRIIDRRLHAVGVQVRRERVAARMPDRVEMIDMAAVRRDLRHQDVLDLVEAGVVGLGRVLPRARPLREMRQFRRQDRGLHAIEPAVDAFDVMLMLHHTAVM